MSKQVQTTEEQERAWERGLEHLKEQEGDLVEDLAGVVAQETVQVKIGPHVLECRKPGYRRSLKLAAKGKAIQNLEDDAIEEAEALADELCELAATLVVNPRTVTAEKLKANDDGVDVALAIINAVQDSEAAGVRKARKFRQDKAGKSVR